MFSTLCSQQPIGIFDSGVGGLTVMQELLQCLPLENFIYLGDTTHLPYGNKSPDAVRQYTLENVAFLLRRQIKLLVVACFTASAHALQDLEKILSIPVIGVIACGLDEVAQATRSQHIALLGTESTIASGVLQSLMRQRYPHMKLSSIACPLFVPFIEEGLLQHEALRLIAQDYLGGLASQGVDAAFLACTHYPLILPVIQDAMGAHMRLIVPAVSCARMVKEFIVVHHCAHQNNKEPMRQFYVTDNAEKFRALAKRFFQLETGNVQCIVV